MLRSSLALLLVGVPAAAFADDLGVVVEPGIAIPLSAPQSNLFNVGGGQAVKVLFGVAPYLDVGPVVSFLYLPSETANLEPGIEWGFGGTARLHRAHDAASYAGVAPWLDVDVRYVRTGDLNRPGFAFGVGLAVPLDAERRYWVGPYVRYGQTITLARDGYDSSDAKILLVGVSFEVGSPGKRAVAPIVLPPPPPPPPPPVAETVISCPDRDGDNIPDAIDHCPDVAGVMENFGCPNYQKLVVKKDKLVLKEKLYFAWDKAVLEPASFPVLDEVVQALKDNPGFRVQIEGHTDSSGADDHNQTLSEQRAGAVLDYLTTHGIAKERLVSKGFASSVPLDTNATVAGRENNRRVEFLVNFVILNTDGAK
jgi:outer membrane protein OmpA-like peptidoglycan-associated protein